MACAKHFLLNNQEHFRFRKPSNAHDRTIHEIYWLPFKRAIEDVDTPCRVARLCEAGGMQCAHDEIWSSLSSLNYHRPQSPIAPNRWSVGVCSRTSLSVTPKSLVICLITSLSVTECPFTNLRSIAAMTPIASMSR
jgi:hypothetical protein